MLLKNITGNVSTPINDFIQTYRVKDFLFGSVVGKAFCKPFHSIEPDELYPERKTLCTFRNANISIFDKDDSLLFKAK